ncbi:EF-hand calcium-binding domain-containing protein 12 isoform X1 [Zootoca vivipara]|uniref:EF-hand calcium-binding domain-containing protein 12 isoform X1 n=1 Tax=Zootoca vivipara TaxID=8524 RepID=UPI00293BE153|nr:EF-hand calcium-binding domain-containing protein 12 isoform X1 [Zootoca vivipara]
MSTKMDQMSWSSPTSGARRGSRQFSISSQQPRLSVLSSPKSEGEAMSNEASCEDSPAENLDWVLDHCFQQFKIREAYPHFFLKVKASRFGPPRSRRRILIAPPMGEMAVRGPRPHPPELPAPEQKPVDSGKPPEVEDKTALKEEADLQELEAWIMGRIELQNLLNCVDLEEWLMRKEPISEQEQNVLRRIQEYKEALKTKVQAKLWEDDTLENVIPKPPHKIVVPRIHAPFPKSLMTLQNLLHKQKLKLVDLFKKSDITKTMRFKRDDFIKIIQETNIPLSTTDLEEVVTYLMMSKKVNYISNDDLVQCQKIWTDNIRDQWRQPKESKPEAEELPPSAPHKSCRKSVTFSKHGEPKICRLEVPPINTEVDRRRLTYNQMEEAGKRYREMKRRAKRKTNPIEYAEQCQLVKSGDAVVDGHCFPSTIQGEMGELVDKHRMACHLVYTQCLKLCEKYGIPLTEKMLKRALLYPPDKIVREGNHFRRMRQPGGYYDQSMYRSRLLSEQSSTSGDKKRKKTTEVKKPEVQKTDKSLNTRYKSYREFWKVMKPYTKKALPPDNYFTGYHVTLAESMGILVEQYVESELRKMFAHLNPKTDPNNFWPGHLLSQLRLFLPEEARDNGNAIFSHVPRTSPAYPARYNPDRSWPVNDQGYVLYGDPESQKRNYYI